MNVGAKLAAFAVVLAATFGLGWAIGAAVEPLGDTDVNEQPHTVETHP